MEEAYPRPKKKSKRPRLGGINRPKSMSAPQLVKIFAGAAQLLSDCNTASLTEDEMSALVDRSMSNRCRSEATRLRVCSFAQGYLEFALHRGNPLPFYGSAAVPAVVQWLDHVRLRGETVPHLAKYCLMVFGESMGIKLPVDYPAVRSAASAKRLVPVKSAQSMPFEFLEKLGLTA